MARDVLFARCAPGLEPYLLSEARKLRLARPEAQPGGVQFTGGLEDVWRANLRLRTASRVLLRVARFPCPDGRSPRAELGRLCHDGLAWRYRGKPPAGADRRRWTRTTHPSSWPTAHE